MKSYLVVLTAMMLLIPPHSLGSEAVLWTPESRQMGIESATRYWIDTDGNTDLSGVLRMPDSEWQATEGDSINHGYVDEPYWFRVEITNPSTSRLFPYFEIGYPVLDDIQFYAFGHNTQPVELALGNHLPFSERPLPHRNFLIPLELAGGESLTLYMRVETGSSMQLPLTLWHPEAFQAQEQNEMLFQGIYYGIALVMVIYHVFVYRAIREKAFLHYIFYIAAMPLFIATLSGLSFQYLWPSATWWNDQLMMIFLQLVVVFGSLFTIRFLSISRNNHPWILRFIRGVIGAALALILVALFLPFEHIILPSIAIAFVACCSMLSVGVIRLIKRDEAAPYYTLAWCFMLFGGMVLALNKFAVLPTNLFTENAVQVGSALGVVLLSIALADRLHKEKQAAFDAQQSALREEKNARRAQTETIKVQEDANVRLEEHVRQRTEELHAANEKLREFSATDALTGLKNRGYFEEAFLTYCVDAFRYQEPLSLMVIDIDHFKHFNDTYGHLVGDECLKMVAGIINGVVTRPNDLAARFGGEEFVVILPETNVEGARQVAERIRRKVEEALFTVSLDSVRVTVSVGISSRVPDRAEYNEELFNEADQALYQAKAASRNLVVVHQHTNTEFGLRPEPQ